MVLSATFRPGIEVSERNVTITAIAVRIHALGLVPKQFLQSPLKSKAGESWSLFLLVICRANQQANAKQKALETRHCQVHSYQQSLISWEIPGKLTVVPWSLCLGENPEKLSISWAAARLV